MGQVPYEANAHGLVYTYTPNNCIYLPKSRKTFIVKNYGVDLSYLIVSLQGRRRLCFVGYVTVYVVDVVEIRGWSCLGMVALWFVWCGDLTRQPPLTALALYFNILVVLRLTVSVVALSRAGLANYAQSLRAH